MCKRCKIYFIGLKKRLVWGDFRIEEIRDKDNETGLKEGRGIEMSTTVLHSRAAPSLCFTYRSRNRRFDNIRVAKYILANPFH